LAGQDKLEVIKPNGDIEFYDLSAGRGIINIGSNEENDIVLKNAGIASFHAVIDYRQKPYQFLVLDNRGEARLRNTQVPAHVSTTLQNWDVIELEGLIIVLTEVPTITLAPSDEIRIGGLMRNSQYGVAAPASTSPLAWSMSS
jgi:hypothetical protein